MKLAKRLIRSVIRPIRNRWVTAGALVDALRSMELSPRGPLMVHSSLSALGYVPGGTKAVIGALLECVGRGGTLVMPTHTWECMEAGQRTFDVAETPCCVGRIPEEFRKQDGVQRSLHPTHSVAAVGPLADALLAGHEASTTPCGAGTPYARLLDWGGQILLLGTGLESNTSYHTIEAMADVPYLLRMCPDTFRIIDQERNTRLVSVRRHRAGIARRFRECEPSLVACGAARIGSVGQARCLLIEGTAFREAMLRMLREDPLHLVQPSQCGQRQNALRVPQHSQA